MALIKCEECGNDVSSEAETCPHCGIKIKSDIHNGSDNNLEDSKINQQVEEDKEFDDAVDMIVDGATVVFFTAPVIGFELFICISSYLI
jgi:uncharacterized membrane protein YvbJ